MLLRDYSPVTIVSKETIKLRIFDSLMSTVEIFVIPPFFAAVRILASALKNKNPRYPVALAVPTLLPIVLLVAPTGNVNEQLETIPTTESSNTRVLIFLIILLII